MNSFGSDEEDDFDGGEADIDYDAEYGPADKSYKFNFGSVEAEEGGRTEEADADGNVRGSYSYVNAEGNRIIVHYSAGPGKGFVIENEEEVSQSVHKATLDGAAKAEQVIIA